ncbi:3-oxoacyl-[acyl-carrier-protein] synthase-3 [Flavobacterium resistens]|uniref:3-oxoacyl-ACP synthase n=1 Tax=Flavobacterium resistens TaxID=443612 RepID=A0A521ES48_9FLAO|nr:ketoacyl-ACP synthase III [Flavobacterium resistens]MRX67938.1 3-oxoacyl-ACP synthase [Flavobacterium resistens]SMO86754.1 3-oxoacyl-[acyl-carrier-protein] synthase-3 [Flavobacterium resistens]
MGAIIRNIEYVFPDQKITNENLLEAFPDYDFDKFEEKVGIKNRYWVTENETALDLAVKACLKLFTKIDSKEIDFILYCTQSPEYFLPTTACVLQNKLDLRKDIGALDFNLGCSGYPYGLSIAKGLINTGQVKNVLLVTAETYSKYLHPNDRSNRAIFGDAATATLISFSEKEYFGDFLFGTDGSGYDKLIVKNGCSRNAYDFNAEEKVYGTNNTYTDNNLYMNGPEVFNFTSEVIPEFTKEVLLKNNKSIDDIHQFVLHQANSFMLNFIRKRLKIEEDKFYRNLSDGGNTVSSTIPIALKNYSQLNNFDEQDVIIVGFGVGLSWSGGLITIKNKL